MVCCPEDLLSPSQLAQRSGVAVSGLHFYEKQGLISSTRTAGNQRRYPRHTLRRLAFIRAAQRVGLSLKDIQAALASLPQERTPTAEDWAKLSAGWKAELDARIETLRHLRDDLSGCIGCGCLSLETCTLQNPDDRVRRNLLGKQECRLAPDTDSD